MKYRFPAMTLSILLLLAAPATTQEGDMGEDVSTFMRAKLVHSQKILEGLTVEDYRAIARNAQALSLLSLSSNWRVLQTEQYVQYSKEFRRLADSLRTAAKKKNLDGATLSYIVLTTNCVACHRHIREARRGEVHDVMP
jgi:hypothetical protein